MSNSTTKISKKSKIKSTGTGKNTALLGIQNNTEPSNENNINDISTKRSLQKSINEKSQDNLAELESKTYELQSQLDNLNSEIEQEKNLLMQDTYQFNSATPFYNKIAAEDHSRLSFLFMIFMVAK